MRLGPSETVGQLQRGKHPKSHQEFLTILILIGGHILTQATKVLSRLSAVFFGILIACTTSSTPEIATVATAAVSTEVYMPFVATPSPNPTTEVVLVSFKSTWKYLDNGSDQGVAWRAANFNDGNWAAGSAVLGYGNGDESTVVSYGADPGDKHITTYFRNSFNVENPADFIQLSLKINRDDGAVVFLNGNEIHRTNMPGGTINHDTMAPSCASGVNEININSNTLVAGTNVLAVEIHQCSAQSSDIRFDLELSGTKSLPGGPGNEFYVSPNGSPNGDGSIGDPWDLSTAFGHPDVVQPGDTVWLRGGTYGNGGDLILRSYLEGSQNNPIIVRAFPGERATIDGTIRIRGDWSTYWDLEVMNSHPTRQTSIPGSHPEDIHRNAGLEVYAENVKLINNVLHDGAGGTGLWDPAAINVEIYGNIIYNNGWLGPDRGHGHGLYAKNEHKQIINNIIFNNFSGYGIHVYDDDNPLTNFTLDQNVIIRDTLLVGGKQPAGDIQLTENHTIESKVLLGYQNNHNQNILLSENILGGGSSEALELRWWDDVEVSENRFWNNENQLVQLSYPDDPATYQWDNNEYYFDGTPTSPFVIDNSDMNWNQWRNETGYDANSSMTANLPAGVQIYIIPNVYQENRFHIVIYNWGLAGQVSLDGAALGMQTGDSYSLHNVHNYYDESIEGTYNGGNILVPMTGWSVATPIGWSEPLNENPFPMFGIFTLIKN